MKMEKIRLGRTGLMVSRSSFGALPIQRVSFEEAREILLTAYEGGINFYDTARGYTDSEEKLGKTFKGKRHEIIIATKTFAPTGKELLEHLDTSLKNLQTDYVDIYQLHNPKELPDPDDPDGTYAAMVKAKKEGKIRFIGITNHDLKVAMKAVDSGLFDTVQFPFSVLSSQKDIDLVNACKAKDVGFIAMKAMSGGLIDNAEIAFAFMRQFDNVVPIWGVQRMSEIKQFLELEENPPVLNDEMWKKIEEYRKELSGAFCRGCGYCLPCPAEIPIPLAARLSYLVNRSPYERFLEDDWKEQMERIENCIDCGHCRDHCPYGLDAPALLKHQLVDYRKFYAEHKGSY